MREIKLVNQECEVSCVVAVIAMVTGKSFKEVLEQSCRLPITEEDQDQILYRLGFKHLRYLYPNLHPDKVYIAGTPSLNHPGHMHAIVIDTRYDELKVYDPQNGRDNKDFYTVENLISWANIVEVLI